MKILIFLLLSIFFFEAFAQEQSAPVTQDQKVQTEKQELRVPLLDGPTYGWSLLGAAIGQIAGIALGFSAGMNNPYITFISFVYPLSIFGGMFGSASAAYWARGKDFEASYFAALGGSALASLGTSSVFVTLLVGSNLYKTNPDFFCFVLIPIVMGVNLFIQPLLATLFMNMTKKLKKSNVQLYINPPSIEYNYYGKTNKRDAVVRFGLTLVY